MSSQPACPLCRVVPVQAPLRAASASHGCMCQLPYQCAAPRACISRNCAGTPCWCPGGHGLPSKTVRPRFFLLAVRLPLQHLVSPGRLAFGSAPLSDIHVMVRTRTVTSYQELQTCLQRALVPAPSPGTDAGCHICLTTHTYCWVARGETCLLLTSPRPWCLGSARGVKPAHRLLTLCGLLPPVALACRAHTRCLCPFSAACSHPNRPKRHFPPGALAPRAQADNCMGPAYYPSPCKRQKCPTCAGVAASGPRWLIGVEKPGATECGPFALRVSVCGCPAMTADCCLSLLSASARVLAWAAGSPWRADAPSCTTYLALHFSVSSGREARWPIGHPAPGPAWRHFSVAHGGSETLMS